MGFIYWLQASCPWILGYIKPQKRQKNARYKCQVNPCCFLAFDAEASSLAGSLIFYSKLHFWSRAFGQHPSLWLPCYMVSLIFLAAVSYGEVSNRIKWRAKPASYSSEPVFKVNLAFFIPNIQSKSHIQHTSPYSIFSRPFWICKSSEMCA